MRQTDEIVSHDAIVVGGGHNALTAAAYLARAGLDVCVLERRDVLGGACVTEELWPGYRVSRASYVVSMLQPKVVADLRLREHGYEPIPLDPAYATIAGRRPGVLPRRRGEGARRRSRACRGTTPRPIPASWRCSSARRRSCGR